MAVARQQHRSHLRLHGTLTFCGRYEHSAHPTFRQPARLSGRRRRPGRRLPGHQWRWGAPNLPRFALPLGAEAIQVAGAVADPARLGRGVPGLPDATRELRGQRLDAAGDADERGQRADCRWCRPRWRPVEEVHEELPVARTGGPDAPPLPDRPQAPRRPPDAAWTERPGRCIAAWLRHRPGLCPRELRVQGQRRRQELGTHPTRELPQDQGVRRRLGRPGIRVRLGTPDRTTLAGGDLLLRRRDRARGGRRHQ